MLKKKATLESKIKRNQNSIEDRNEKIESSERQKEHYILLASKVISMVKSVGSVYEYTNLEEELKFNEDGIRSKYEYSLNECAMCVITGVYMTNQFEPL